jgi:hypothetical protein
MIFARANPWSYGPRASSTYGLLRVTVHVGTHQMSENQPDVLSRESTTKQHLYSYTQNAHLG